MGLVTIAAVISIMANYHRAWTETKAVTHQAVCVVKTGHKCKSKPMTIIVIDPGTYQEDPTPQDDPTKEKL